MNMDMLYGNKRIRMDDNSTIPGANGAQVFTITFGPYDATIRLSATALRNYPKSLLSTTLLGEHNMQYHLAVPTDRGLEAMSSITREIYEYGCPTVIPPRGVQFDVFYQWLSYLGLSVPNRSLSDELAGSREVSFFVEILLNSLIQRRDWSRTNWNEVPAGRLARRVRCYGVPSSVDRHLYDLLPFEFARRGIHVTIKEGGTIGGWRDVDLDVSGVELGRDKEGKWQRGEFCRAPESSVAPHTVIGVHRIVLEDVDSYPTFKFKHRGQRYQLSCRDTVVGDPEALDIQLHQLGIESCIVAAETSPEYIIVVDSEEDLVARFLKNRKIEPRRYLPGHILFSCDQDSTAEQMPLVHGAHIEVADTTANDLQNKFMLVVCRESHPFLSFREAGAKASTESYVEMIIDESPAKTSMYAVMP